MRSELYALENPSAPHIGDQVGLEAWIRSVKRDAVVILNEALILAWHIFGH